MHLPLDTLLLILLISLNCLAAVFWVRGLWYGRMSDCAAGLLVLLVWPMILLFMTSSSTALNILGFASMGFGVFTLVASTFIPQRPRVRKNDVQAVAALMLVGGLCLTLIL